MCYTSLESPFSLGSVGLKPDGGSGPLVLGIGLWPSFPGRGGNEGLRLGVPRAEPKTGLGCRESFWEISGNGSKGMGK